MAFGILEVRSSKPVPGTVTIFEDTATRITNPADRDPNLRYDKTGEILLVPQPSNDPNDPLNWPLWRRDLILFIISLAAIIATTLSPILAADSLLIAFHFELNFTKIALLTGYHLLGVGIGGVFFVPSARVWGKRHLYLLGTLLVCVSSVWAGASQHSYTSLLWARIVQGIALAPFEALVSASVGDLYYVHERGARMAMSTMAVFGSAFFTPIVVGKMADTIGWGWSFYFIAIFSGILFPIMFFFCPETAFVRNASLNTDITGSTNVKSETSQHNQHGSPSDYYTLNDTEPKQPTTATTASSTISPTPTASKSKSYLSTLSAFSGRKTHDSFLHLFLRPFPLFLHPSVLWACLTQGTLIGWTVLIGIVLAAIFLAPPLYFTATKVGYMYTSAFIGALLGFFFCGLLSDWSARALMRRNKGVYEPEFRIVLVIPQIIAGCGGLFAFGITANDTYRYGWLGPCISFAFVTFGMVCGAVASSLYLVDAHREIAVETFTCLMIFKNVFSFALTFRGYDWLVGSSVKRVFVAVACVQVGVGLLSLPMWVGGKWNRAFWAGRGWLGGRGKEGEGEGEGGGVAYR